MDSRRLAGILSSLISQLIVLLLHIFPSQPPLGPPNSLLPLLLFSNQLTTTTLARKRKRDNNASNLHILTPDSFRNSFMMTCSSFQWLSGLLEPLLECRDPADLLPLNLSPSLRLAIGLSRLAKGHDYPAISAHFSVPVPVAKFCVKQLCRVLCTNFRFWVSFPSDLRPISLSFQSLSPLSLPSCCGVLLCARFQVNSSSVAAQFVVDSSFRFLTIAAGFLPHKSDSQILKNSSLFHDIQQGTLLNSLHANPPFYLLADSRYPLLPWLMTPYTNPPPDSPQANFNSAHAIMRLPALRAAASLRNWGVLSKPVSEDLKMAVAYIAACSILHNSLLMRDDFSALASGFEDCHGHPCDVVHSEGHDEIVNSKALALRDTLAKKASDFKD